MKSNAISFQEVYSMITEFRQECNLRFDKLEIVIETNTNERNKMFKEMDIRIKPLERLADRALFVILLVSGLFATLWQFVVGYIKKELKI